MKKILITGANSYIGTSFKKWVSQYPELYSVDTISIRDDSWKETSFSEYDVIYHTAAIVHVTENNTAKYFKINRDLTIEIAIKAKEDGVNQFIFLSTMGVYGTETGYITKDTIPTPKTAYAQSKYAAEQLLLDINSRDFNVAVVRPPIVYGKGCPGNYSRLADMAIKLPVFPDLDNERSMIFIENLSEFTKILIDNNQNGTFFPQNRDYVNITELVRLIANSNGKKIKTTKVFNWAIVLALNLSETLKKVFGSFVYDKNLSNVSLFMKGKKLDYEVVSFPESITLTEKK